MDRVNSPRSASSRRFCVSVSRALPLSVHEGASSFRAAQESLELTHIGMPARSSFYTSIHSIAV